MPVKYLLTGASGNLGGSIARELANRGADIRALVLPGDKAVRRIPAGIEIVEGDILNREDLRRFFDVPPGTETIVIHSAGIVSIAWKYVKPVYEVNVQGTQNIVDECIRSRVKRLVYISSVHAIPELPKGSTMREVTAFNPDEIIGFYGKTKAMASKIVMDAVKNDGLDAVLIFPTGLCGPYDYAVGHITQLMMDCLANRLPAGIKGGFDFVDVRDVAAGVVVACEKGVKGEGYILGNRYVPVREILDLVHEQAGVRHVKFMLPIWAARLLVPFFGLYYKIKRRLPVFTRYSIHTLTTNSAYSSDKAKKALGYKTRPFERTIADSLRWIREEMLQGKRYYYKRLNCSMGSSSPAK